MAGSTTACLFCGRTGVKLTGEHVYPRWLHRALNLRGDVTFSTSGEALRTMPTLDVKIREVCEECNNGWLHDLERAFRTVMLLPLNGLGGVQMPKAIQLTVATWAVKTAYLIERSLGYIRGRQAVEPEHGIFRALYESREPPLELQVFIGGVAARGTKTVSFVATQWVGADDPPAGIAEIFTIGCVLFIVYAPVLAPGAPLPAQFYRLGFGHRMAPYLRQIWPHQVEVVEWPPPSILPADQLRVLWPSGGRMMARVPPA